MALQPKKTIVVLYGLIASGKTTLFEQYKMKHHHDENLVFCHEPVEKFREWQGYDPLKVLEDSPITEAPCVQLHIMASLEELYKTKTVPNDAWLSCNLRWVPRFFIGLYQSPRTLRMPHPILLWLLVVTFSKHKNEKSMGWTKWNLLLGHQRRRMLEKNKKTRTKLWATFRHREISWAFTWYLPWEKTNQSKRHMANIQKPIISRFGKICSSLSELQCWGVIMKLWDQLRIT